MSAFVEVGHVEPFPAVRTFHEMIGLGFGRAVRIEAGMAGSKARCYRIGWLKVGTGQG
jgi:hypothetical protein